ncbi:MAG: nucleoid-associated protein [Bacteroidales bacterium]|jgi:hypothetical protein|nr:nucleoid-associated protein [Bacteroidales bacterium]
MELISNYLYVVDRETLSVTNNEMSESQPLRDYVMNVLNKVLESVGDREYRFQSNSITMQTWLNQIITQDETENVSKLIAQRLLNTEIEAQKRIEHLDKEIPKGMLIVSLVDMELSEHNEKKIIIIKADYNQIIERRTGSLQEGLATKKKFYKAFIANVISNEIMKMTTYDTNSTMANYWWKDFLELEVIRKDNINTKNAFDAIEKEIINPIKSKSRQDYLHLWNLTLGYFRLEGEFNLDDYRDNIIGRYVPYDESISISDLQAKCNDLSNRGKFDRRFNKDISKIKGKKLKKIIRLTNEIDLILKDTVPNLSDILVADENEAGEKFLKIKSPEGYEYAKKIKRSGK